MKYGPAGAVSNQLITGKDRANFSPAELVCWTELSNIVTFFMKLYMHLKTFLPAGAEERDK